MSSGYTSLRQVVIQECLFTLQVNFGNSGAIVFGSSSNLTNIIIQNNVFYASGDATRGILSFSQASNNLNHSIFFINNIFHNLTGGKLGLMNIIGNPRQGIMFSNNIFDGVNPIDSLVQNSSYTNNIININIDLNAPTCLSCVGSGNIVNQSPLLVNLPTGAAFSFTHNYNLSASSPCIGTGLNGIDMGVMGGNGKYKHSGEPFIPQIDEFVIFNPVVPRGTPLQIRVKGTSLDQ
jgi:hypothetical protein